MEIKVFNRQQNVMETEQVYGEKYLEWLYQSKSGKKLGKILSSSIPSKLYGYFQNTPASSKKIEPFIKDFKINMDEFLPEEGAASIKHPYRTFNNFFIRRFKEGKRTFISEKNKMPAFCEARYLGFDKIERNMSIPVKGKFLLPRMILANPSWNGIFEEGPLLIARLCPVDYHRFHYPDDGVVLDYYNIKGPLHSVNPLALKMKGNVLCTNERRVAILETKNFGKLAYVEVGAMCVGKIVQTCNKDNFLRGNEKGYFLFGGSTVIVIGEKGRWIPSKDILENSSKGIETYIKLGDQVATKD